MVVRAIETSGIPLDPMFRNYAQRWAVEAKSDHDARDLVSDLIERQRAELSWE